MDGSGISLFRVPADVKLRGDDGPGVEIIQNHHRYAVAWPSVHPDVGQRYRWLWPNDRRAEIPDVDDLPELPKAHLKRLLEPRRPAAARVSTVTGRTGPTSSLTAP